jgi:GT2 family glycosyltransferase
MSIRVSIIVPTLRRKSYLIRLLESLAPQMQKDYEIIVVEQVERNEKEIKDFAKKKKLSLVYTFLPEASMTHARNAGVALAKGDYVLFLDDDVTARAGLVENHVKNFSDDRVAATCGRCITEGQEVEADRQNTGRISWIGISSDGFSSDIRQEIDTVIGCNMCWRKDVYVSLGGADEKFTGNALREDTDLSLRAKHMGYKIVFEPKAIIDHKRAESGGARKTEGRIAWYFHFFSNETYFFLKHRPFVLLPIYLFMKTEWAIRCMFGIGREVSIRSMITPMSGILDGVRKYITL